MTKFLRYSLVVGVLLLNLPLQLVLASTPGNPDQLVNPLRTGQILLRLKGNPEIYKMNAPVDRINDLVAQYRKSPLVDVAEPDQTFQANLFPDDTYFIKQTYENQIFTEDAWDRTQGSDSVVIAIIDSGVQLTHPDLANNIWVNKGEIPGDNIDNDNNGFIDDVNGWDFVQDVADPNPKPAPTGQATAAALSGTSGQDLKSSAGPLGLNHGTVVAGMAAGKGNNKQGIAGICWNCKIMSVRILDANGLGDTVNVVKGIDYAVQNGANIINLSFVGFDTSTLMDEAIARAYAHNVVVVSAAGNDVVNGGTNLDETPAYPVCSNAGGSDNMVIGVSAVDSTDHKAHFSNYGGNCVDIAAPGVNLFSTQAQFPNLGLFDQYGEGWSGTSLATPLVSGAAGLLKSMNPSATNKQIIQALLTGSDSIDSLNPDYAGKLGAGRLNIFKAILNISGLPQSPTPTASTPVQLNLPGNGIQAQSLVIAPAGYYKSDIKIYDLESRVQVKTFSAFPIAYTGGLNLAVGDLNADGGQEIVVAPGVGGPPQIKIFDTKGNLKKQFFAGPTTARGGATVALEDLDGDGRAEIIVGSGKGQKPTVSIFDHDANLLRQFPVFDPTSIGGVSVASADVDSQAGIEVVVASGPGTVGKVATYDLTGKEKLEITPYPKFTGGINVTVGEFDNSGFRNIIVGPGSGGGPQVRVFNMLGNAVASFFAFDDFLRGGVNVTSGNVLQQLGDEIIAGAGKNSAPKVAIYDNQQKKNIDFSVFPSTYRGGVRTAVLNEKIIK